MGLEHGVYCLGCCWLLFVILFPLGVMNVPAMVLLAALIFLEKSFSRGQQIARIAGVGLLVYGAVVLFFPGALGTMIF
jgi:predicted metal-binding membrane protein